MNFVATGDLIEIFPLVFFYQTRESLDLAMRPTIIHKKEYLQLLLSQYDAYYHNRNQYDEGNTEALDRQWRVYFDAADRAQQFEKGNWSATEGVDVLLEGLNAHLMYDLPRAIRYVTSKSEANKRELAKDFNSAKDLYADAEQKAKADILKTMATNARRKEAQNLFGNGAEYVKYVRTKSWEMGVGNGPLVVLQE